MSAKSTSLRTGAVLLLALPLVTLFGPAHPSASAQEPGRRAQTGGRPVSEIVARLSQSASAIVLADSSVQQERAAVPSRAVTSSSLEAQLSEVVKALPTGTFWVKLYLPTPAGERWHGDDVSQYAQAQARLVGRRIGGPTTAGTVEILGQEVAEAQARDIISTLHLHRVYLVTNPNAHPAGLMSSLNREQREQFAQQFNTLDSANRARVLQQLINQIGPQMDMIKTLSEQLTEEERIQLKQGLGGKGNS